MRGRLYEHEIEILLEIDERKYASCTQDEIADFLENNPKSSLAKIYDLDFPENTPSEVVNRVTRITALLFNGKIPHPSQTLEDLCEFIDQKVIAQIPNTKS